MNKKIQSLAARVDSTLLLSAAALGAAAIPAVTAEATVITSGPVNIAVPNNVDGIYINFVTGVTGSTASSVPGFDFDPYSGGGNLLFYFGGDAGAQNFGVAASTTGPYLVLQPGAIISSSSTFSQSANGTDNETAAFLAGVNGYLGVQFTNEATGIANFGYVHFRTTGNTGFPATILDYGYENAGGAITIPSVPEPTSAALFGAAALGAIGLRTWKRRQG